MVGLGQARSGMVGHGRALSGMVGHGRAWSGKVGVPRWGGPKELESHSLLFMIVYLCQI